MFDVFGTPNLALYEPHTWSNERGPRRRLKKAVQQNLRGGLSLEAVLGPPVQALGMVAFGQRLRDEPS
jgi:hypothetical protein